MVDNEYNRHTCEEMPSDKPKVQIRFEEEDYKYLESWAKEEFSTLTQLCRAIILKAVSTRKQEDKEK